MTSTAERLNANVEAPNYGRVICVAIAAGDIATIDLDDPSLVPLGLPLKEAQGLWRGRFVRVKATGGRVHFAMSKDSGDTLVQGFTGVTGTPALTPGVGVPIDDGQAPEMFMPGQSSPWRYMQFSNATSGTVFVTVSEASEKASGL